MKVRREIASVPLRTAGETWQAIVDLITGHGSIDAAAENRRERNGVAHRR